MTNNIEQHIHNNHSFLQNLALKLTKNMDDSKDLLQDTVVKILLNGDRFQAGTSFKAWSMTIMRNLFINNVRRNTRITQSATNTKMTKYLYPERPLDYHQGEMLMSYEEIIKCVEKVEDKFKIPFMMFFEGYRYEEIARELELPLGTVKSRISIARKRLKSMLSKSEIV